LILKIRISGRMHLSLLGLGLFGGPTLTGCGPALVAAWPVTVSAATQASINSTTNFGDSITCGFGASVGANNYASKLDAAIGKPSVNWCRPADQAADMARLWVYPHSLPTAVDHQLYTVLIGTNDANNCGPSSACIANWWQSLESSLAWLAIPSSDKILAVDCPTKFGAWAPELGSGLATTMNGASLNFNVSQTIANRNLYVAYRVFDSAAANPGTAILSVDGRPVATLTSAVSTGQSLSTWNGTVDTIVVAKVNLGQIGPHAVNITTTTANGGVFSVQWIGVPGQNYATDDAAPHVIVGSVTSSSSQALNKTIALYNTQLNLLVSSLVADGLHISIAPTSTAIDTSTDLKDGLHPNDLGHAKIAREFTIVL